MTDLKIRNARREDDEQVQQLFRASLGRKPEDPNEALFDWKHRQNAFGESPAWVALDRDRIVGFRTFMRWRFVDDEGKTHSAVRAVDTVTSPDYQGRGIFRRLTLQAVAELTLAGDRMVFNTPNEQSRPGYLKMGWTVARHLPVGMLPAGARGAKRMLRSRVPAKLWSEVAQAGVPARELLADRAVGEQLLEHAPSRGFRTDRTPDYLAWRTSLEPLHYRVLPVSDRDWAEGGLVFRVRQRGPALEAAVIEQLVPDRLTGARLVARLLKETGADYAIGLRTGPAAGLIPVPVPGFGPILTTRPLAGAPPAVRDWTLTLGDIELF
ncbi:GNAT family N-acetyltransferase [Granulicoccus sp. GXG6511]|uniref:GNAT family N-acetyltransferase n=1 Tax=Granulicoccus sp. GXG6511 TaxID=3381351 RepID=UPI003D7CE77B